MFVQKFIGAIFAAAAFVAAAAATSAPAQADVDVYLGLGAFPSYYDEPGYRRHHRHRFRISCWEGKDRVEWAGFRRVRAIDCDGSRYAYKARRHGDSFIVSVNSRSGRIVSVRETY